MDDPEELLGRLIRHGVDFVIVGRFACAAYGAGTYSGGAEVGCDFSTENLMKLQAALADAAGNETSKPDVS